MTNSVQRAARRLGCIAIAAAVLVPAGTTLAQTPSPSPATSTHVIVVVTDGFRWQELFAGADSAYIGRAGKVEDTAALRRDFWKPTAVERRQTLLPFMWGTMATQGQIFGDSSAGSPATVTNGRWFSYPGYSELFTGHVDPNIDSNEYPPNPNRTVFEWLNQQPALRGQVAAFATWDAFRRIINTGRSGVPVFDGWDNAVAPTGTPRAAVLHDLLATHTRMWSNNVWDAITHSSAVDYLATKRPRVMFIGYGETDEWAHDGRYDLYLRSAHQVDAYLAALWQQVQTHPDMRNRTTLIVTTDHGRGVGAKWTDHGERVPDAKRMWIAVMGPDVAPLGVRRNVPATQSQVAATVAAALGLNWPAVEPKAAPPLPVFTNRMR